MGDSQILVRNILTFACNNKLYLSFLGQSVIISVKNQEDGYHLEVNSIKNQGSIDSGIVRSGAKQRRNQKY